MRICYRISNIKPVDLIELWRGDLREGTHQGHAVICDHYGIVQSWGDADAVIFPRSSCKIMQAVPLLESGAADRFGLSSRHLALACASHSGAAIHVDGVRDWLGALDLGDNDLRCGCHRPWDKTESRRLQCNDTPPSQAHNNCSGKHAGFLTLRKHLRGGADYHLIDHPVQRAVKQAHQDLTGQTSPGYGIDGCSAPNHTCTIIGLAMAMARFARPPSDRRGAGMARLRDAMIAHPDLVAGEGRACTEIMRACEGRVAVKTGAEAVYTAIIPDRGMGVAVKITDGGARAAESAIAAILVHLGVLAGEHPVAEKYITNPQVNWSGICTGELRLAAGFPG